ncbi:MAG: hypothetical protein FWH42_04180 [Dehalococcoidia bacterium]|nr:hypothetical protein [Dehalococcoidia bacterium]
MKQIGAALCVVVTGFLLALFMPTITTQILGVMQQQETQVLPNIPTSSFTSVDLTLNSVVLNNSLSNIISVSGQTGETLTPTDISADGKTITVTGFAPNAVRNVTVTFYTDSTAGFTGLKLTLELLPLVLIVAGIGIAVAGGFSNNRSS